MSTEVGSKKLEESLITLRSISESTEINLEKELNELSVRDLKWRTMEDEAVKILSTSSKQMVRLNISGKKFATTIETLMSIKDTIFYKLITSHKIDMNKEIFFDRSPKFFSDILDYIRYKTFHYTKYNEDELDEIYIEALYYELTEILDHMGDRLNNVVFTKFESSGDFLQLTCVIGTQKVEDLHDKSLTKGICTKAPGWIIIDFNHEWEFSQINIGGYNGDISVWNNENGASSTIHTSKDRTNWTQVGLIPTGFGKAIKTVDVTKTSAKYIKFNSGGLLGIGHLEIKKQQGQEIKKEKKK